MVIQMVGGHVGDHRHLGAAAHADQLKAGKLHHRLVRRVDLIQDGQQSPADVAAQMHGTARRLKHSGDQAGGGGLAVRTGDRGDLAGAVLEEQLHLTGHQASRCLGRLQSRCVILKARRAHDDVLPGQAVQVILTQTQGHAQLVQCIRILAEVRQLLFITQSHLCSHGAELPDQCFVTYAGADEGYLFALDEFGQPLLILLHIAKPLFPCWYLILLDWCDQKWSVAIIVTFGRPRNQIPRSYRAFRPFGGKINREAAKFTVYLRILRHLSRCGFVFCLIF